MATGTASENSKTQTQQTEPVEVVAKKLEGILDDVLERTIKARGQIDLTADGVSFGNFEGMIRYARMLVSAGVVPPIKGEAPDQTLSRTIISINLGRRVGLAPEESVQSIYVVNCRAQMWGDAPLAVCRQHKDWVESGFDEWFEVDGKRIKGNPSPEDFAKDSTTAWCTSLRRGAAEPKTHSFSMADAKKVPSYKTGNLYQIYPYRMLRFRARGYNLRDNFGDALKGIAIRELYDPGESTAERLAAEEAAAESMPATPRASFQPQAEAAQASPINQGMKSLKHPEEPQGSVLSPAASLLDQFTAKIVAAAGNARALLKVNEDLEEAKEQLGSLYKGLKDRVHEEQRKLLTGNAGKASAPGTIGSMFEQSERSKK